MPWVARSGWEGLVQEGKIQAWLARLSDRERSIVVGGGVAVLAAVLLTFGFFVQQRVAEMELAVADNAEALRQIRDAAPAYLSNRKEDRAIDESLERARATSLQSSLLALAKEIQFERKVTGEEEGPAGTERLSDFIKFSNASEILAELTARKGAGGGKAAAKKKKPTKGEKQVFLSSIEVVFDRVPDTALFQFLEKIDTHPDGLFASSLDVSRESTDHEHFRAKLTIAQFRYGGAEEGS